jgi:hypothetical protein
MGFDYGTRHLTGQQQTIISLRKQEEKKTKAKSEDRKKEKVEDTRNNDQ